MRTCVLLFGAFLAGCVATTADSSATASEATESGAALASSGTKRPSGLFLASVALGRMANETFGAAPNLDDSTDAQLYRLQFEAGKKVGGGVNIELMQTDDDLHAVGSAGADIEQFDLFAHVTIHTSQAPQFRCPVRIGPFLNVTDLRGGDVTILRTKTVGLRVGVEPEVDLSQSEGFRLSLFGNANIGGGVSDIESDVIVGEFDTTASALGVEVGLRSSMPGFTVGLAYIYRALNVAESDPSGSVFVEETDYIFNGVHFSLGVRW